MNPDDHAFTLEALEGPKMRWTCACGARGEATFDYKAAWRGYYRHVVRALNGARVTPRAK